MLKVNTNLEEIKTVEDAFNYVKELVNRECDMKWKDKHLVANILFGFIEKEKEDVAHNEFKSLIRKDDVIEEVIFDGKYAVCSTKWNDSEVYYYVIDKTKKRNGGTVHESKEEAIVAFLAEQNGNEHMSAAVFKLIGFIEK